MNTIRTNPSITNQMIDNTNKVQKTKTAEVELTRGEIMSSKDLTVEQKLDKLGIKPMTVEEMATGLVDKIIDGEV